MLIDTFSRLIAIMLGRFRMTVLDCLQEYENLGGKIFGKPRFFTAVHFGVISRTKYKGSTLKKIFEDVTSRRSELLHRTDDRITFPSKRGLCRTLVSLSFSLIFWRREPSFLVLRFSYWEGHKKIDICHLTDLSPP